MAAALAGPPLAAGLSVLFFRDLRLISVLYVLLMTAGLVLIMLGQPELSQRQRVGEHA
jgi:hypothetical protein